MVSRDDKRRLRSSTMTERDVELMLAKLDSRPAATAQKSRRVHKRFPYRMHSLSIKIQQPGAATPTNYVVNTRNISAGGLCFVHGAFVHNGSRCIVQLVTQHGAWQDVLASVVHCRYLERGMHEVSVMFDQHVRPSDFCTAAVSFDFLLVEHDDAMARLATHHLALLNVEVERAENGQIAVEKCESDTFDCVLMDMDMPVMDGWDATHALRARGFTRDIVAMTGMSSPEDREKCLEVGCTQYFAKPASPEIYASILELLKQEPITSTFKDDESMRDLIAGFAAAMPAEVRKIEEAWAARDLGLLQTHVCSMKASAAGYGFDVVADIAEAIEKGLIDSIEHSRLDDHIQKLITMCMQVCASNCATEPSGAAPEAEPEESPPEEGEKEAA